MLSAWVYFCLAKFNIKQSVSCMAILQCSLQRKKVLKLPNQATLILLFGLNTPPLTFLAILKNMSNTINVKNMHPVYLQTLIILTWAPQY